MDERLGKPSPKESGLDGGVQELLARLVVWPCDIESIAMNGVAGELGSTNDGVVLLASVRRGDGQLHTQERLKILQSPLCPSVHFVFTTAWTGIAVHLILPKKMIL